MCTKILAFLLLIFPQQVFSQTVTWQNRDTKLSASFRGLSVADDSVVWVSGSNGQVGISTRSGEDWKMKQVAGFEKSDFRTLYAFNSKTAIIANAGSPAYILRTTDGGVNWKLVYKNDDSAAFFDGIGFWNNKEGIIYGDPINGRMMMLRTSNGGKSWKALPDPSRPVLENGEASFAASGTAIRCMGNGKVVIATGGKISRLWVSADKGKTWKTIKAPIIQGLSSTGIFSVAFADEQHAIIVGGDYKRDTLKTDHVFYTKDGGKTWQAPTVPTRGYRECVEYISKKIVIATRPGGTDISYDGGVKWEALPDEKGFHAVRKSRKGRLIVLTGSNGKISLLKINTKQQ